MGLTKGQKQVFAAYQKGLDFFVTGDAGTGKSYLIEKIVEDARRKGKRVMVVAPTGKAARNIDGATIHSAFKIGLGVVGPEEIFYGKTDKTQKRELDAADLIICDELSMVRFDLFSAVSRSIKKAAERSGVPKQILYFGDFYQLPPVLDEKKEGEAYHKIYDERLFAFENDEFPTLRFCLKEKMRTKDAEFSRILDRLRVGDASVLDVFDKKFLRRSKTAVTICAKNREAEDINVKMLGKLKRRRIYRAQKKGAITEDDKFAPELLEIAPDAHILFTQNDKNGRWINGTDGIVKECYDDHVDVIVNGESLRVEVLTQDITKSEVEETTDTNGKKKYTCKQTVIGSYTQYPMKLGWAISIHKSQGMTLAELNIDPSGCFTHGQLYVAISRCKSLDGIHFLCPPRPEHLICWPAVNEFMESISASISTVSVSEEEERKYSAKIIAVEKVEERKTPETVTVSDVEHMISAYAASLMRKYGIFGHFEGRIVTEAAMEKSEQKKAAKMEREEALAEKIEELEPEILRRLVVQDSNTQAVYQCLRDVSGGGGSAKISAERLAEAIGISRRSVETGLAKLRKAGLTESSGSKKTPEIRLVNEFDDTGYEHCLLLQKITGGKEEKRAVCFACGFLNCPAHPK